MGKSFLKRGRIKRVWDFTYLLKSSNRHDLKCKYYYLSLFQNFFHIHLDFQSHLSRNNSGRRFFHSHQNVNVNLIGIVTLTI